MGQIEDNTTRILLYYTKLFKGAITSYGEFVVQNTYTTTSNSIYFFDKSGHYEFTNGQLVYVADDPIKSSVSDQGSGSLAIR